MFFTMSKKGKRSMAYMYTRQACASNSSKFSLLVNLNLFFIILNLFQDLLPKFSSRSAEINSA